MPARRIAIRRCRFRKGEVPSRGPRHAVETGLFFGERVERIRTSAPRDCRSFPTNRLTISGRPRSASSRLGRLGKGWYIARRPLSIESAEALAGGEWL